MENQFQADNQVFIAADALQDAALGGGVGKRVRIKLAVPFDVVFGAADGAGRDGVAACVHHAPSAALHGGVLFVLAHFAAAIAKCGVSVFKLPRPIVGCGDNQAACVVGKTDFAVFGDIAAFAFGKIVRGQVVHHRPIQQPALPGI